MESKTSSSSMPSKELELEESFSFSCHELNSALQSLYCPSSDDDDESYIEIDLDSAPQSREFELRISFEFPRQIPAVDLSSPLSDPEVEICCDGGLTFPTVEISSCEEEETDIRAVQPRVKGCNGVNDYSRKSRLFVRRLRNDGLFCCRTPSKIASAVNNSIMKFFIKLRSGSVVSSFMSLIKSYYTVSLRSNRGSGHSKRSHDSSQSLTRPFCALWTQTSNTNIIFSASSSAGPSNYRNYRKKSSKKNAVFREK